MTNVVPPPNALLSLTCLVCFTSQGYSAEKMDKEVKEAIDLFKESKMEFSAQVSAVAAAEGVSKNAKYELGVAVFTIARGGLMYEASVGGQKFKYTPIE